MGSKSYIVNIDEFKEFKPIKSPDEDQPQDKPHDKPQKSSSPKKPPHNGKPINMIEISPNGKYLVTYSEKDKTIVGWNVKNIEQVHTIKVDIGDKEKIFHICISDKEELAYINNYYYIGK